MGKMHTESERERVLMSLKPCQPLLEDVTDHVIIPSHHLTAYIGHTIETGVIFVCCIQTNRVG